MCGAGAPPAAFDVQISSRSIPTGKGAALHSGSEDPRGRGRPRHTSTGNFYLYPEVYYA